MIAKPSQTFKTKFAGQIFRVFLFYALFPSIVIITLMAKNSYDQTQQRLSEYNTAYVKQIALNGLSILNLLRDNAQSLGHIYLKFGADKAREVSASSPFFDISLATPDGVPVSIKGRAIPLSKNKYSDYGNFESSYIEASMFYFTNELKIDDSRHYITLSIPLFEIWKRENLGPYESLCISTGLQNEAHCVVPDDQDLVTKKTLTLDEALTEFQWGLFIPGYRLEEKLQIYLFHTDTKMLNDDHPDTTQLLPYLAAISIIGLLSVFFIRRYTKPLETVKAIGKKFPLSTPEQGTSENELANIATTMAQINKGLNNKVNTLSAIKAMGEDSLSGSNKLAESLLANLTLICPITACAFLEFKNNKPYSLLIQDRHGSIERKQYQFNLLNIELSRIISQSDGIIPSAELGEIIKCSHFQSHQSANLIFIGNSPETHGILAYELQLPEDPEAHRDIARFSEYSQLAFRSRNRESQLEDKANIDPLTGLINRERMNTLILQQTDNAETPFAFMFIDLDNFKHVNDTMGHLLGDEALKIAAEKITASLQTIDCYLSRFGGDEFTVFLPGISSKEAVYKTAQKIIRQLGSYSQVQEMEISLSASIGIVFSDGPSDPIELLRQSDIAMYNAKSLGRSRVSIYDQKQDQKIRARVALEHLVRNLNPDSDVTVYYQAKVDRNLKISGFEALARFISTDNTILAPLTIVTQAEQTGKIVAIGNSIIKKVCLQLSIWREQKIFLDHVSINISPVQLHEDDFPSQVVNICAQYQIPHQWIEFEITESELIDTNGKAASCLRKLHGYGFKLAVDDFGTGYSCFTYITDLPLHRIKVDHSLTMHLVNSSRHLNILKSLVEMGRFMGLELTIEGIETEQERDLVIAEGCDELQGYLFSKPVDAIAATALLRSNQYQ